jgi:hypothetical protein
MDSNQSTTGTLSSEQRHWGRNQISQFVGRFRHDRQLGMSMNRSAVEHHVPRSTAQIWMRNRARLDQQADLEPTLIEFFRITPRARVPT